MKKITSLLSALALTAFGWQANAQLNEDFEGAFPNIDWEITAGSGSITQSSVIPDHTTGSGQFADYDCYNTNGATPAYLETPTLVVTATDKTFSFWANYYLVGGAFGQSASLTVDVSSDDGFSWTTGTTNYIAGQQGGGWIQSSIDLSNFEGQDFTGNDVIVRFATVSDYGSYNIAIDDVEGPAVFVPACPAPNTLSTTETATTADLSWVEAGSATSWEVEYDTTGFPTGTGISAITSSNPYNITGLTANTSYDFYVRSICGAGDTSTLVGPFTFTTPCVAFTLPWVENFDAATSTPSCWSQGTTNGEPWIFATTGGHVGNAGAIGGATASGNNFAYVDDSTPDNTGTTLQSPFVDVSSLTVPMLSFYLISNNEGFDNVNFSVDVWDGAVWNTGVYTNNSNTLNGEWEQISVVLSSLTITGPVQLRFIVDEPATGSFYDDVAIDDVTFIEAPACPTPSNLLASVTATAADLSWTENGTATSWEIEYDTAGFVSGTGISVVVGSNPYNLTGISPNTSYDYYIRAICGPGDTSAWSSPFNFTTPCATYTPNYLEDFTTFVPSCWDQASDGTPNTGATGTGTSEWNHTSYLNAGGTNDAVKINLWNTGTNDWLLSPTFDLSAGGWELAINAGVTGYNSNGPINMGSDDTVQVLVTTDGGGTWVVLHTWDVNNQPTNAGDLTTIDLSTYTGADNMFAIWASEGINDDPEDYDFHINDFEIRIPPSCAVPTSLSANVTTTTADLVWTENGTATSWEVEYDTTGFTIGTGISVITSTNPHALTGLTSTTSYQFYIRAICGAGDTSDWVGPYTFSTAPDYCAGDNFYDNGGLSGNYFDASNDTIVICPGTPGDIVTATFNSFATESGYDSLFIFNGNGTAGTLLAGLSGTTTPANPFISTDTSGCLTFVFISDGGVNDAGWDASITCGPAASCEVNLGLDTIVCAEESITLDAGAGDYLYSWSIDGNPNVNAAQSIVLDSNTVGGIGIYSVSVNVTDTLTNCTFSDTILVEFSICTGINNVSENVSTTVYPNPNNGVFTINVNTTDVKELNITVMNVQGQTVFAKNNFDNITTVNEQIDLSNNAKGIYFINVTSDKGVKTHKVIVQ